MLIHGDAVQDRNEMEEAEEDRSARWREGDMPRQEPRVLFAGLDKVWGRRRREKAKAKREVEEAQMETEPEC